MPLAMNLLQVSVSCSQIFFKPDFISWMSSFIRENLGAERIFLRRFFFVEYSTFFCLVPFFEKASLMEKMDLLFQIYLVNRFMLRFLYSDTTQNVHQLVQTLGYVHSQVI